MKKNKKISNYQNVIIISLLIIVLFTMTTGFALYNQLITIGGNITLLPDGKFDVTNITLTDSHNVVDSVTPTYVDGTINFQITFHGTEGDYYAEYDIDLVNNSSYDYTFNAMNFTPSINSSGSDDGSLSYQLTGIQNGEVIPPKTTKHIKLRLTLNGTHGTTYDVGVETDVDTTEEERGNLLGSLSVISNDLRDSDTASFTLTVLSTYSTEQTFRVVSANDNFILIDNNGDEISELIANPNTETSYTLYVKTNSEAVFATDTESSLIQIYSYNAGYENVDTINFEVEMSAIHDTVPPQIGNIQMKINDTVGQIDVSWDRLDSGGTKIVDYGVILYKSTTENGTYTKEGDTLHTNSESRSMTLSGLSEGYYYVDIYGVDKAQNSGIDYKGLSTNDNYYVFSSKGYFKWVFSINITKSNEISYDGTVPSTVNLNQNFTVKFTYDSNYKFSSISVKIGGVAVNSVSGSNTKGYKLSNSNKTLEVYKVDGDVDIDIKSEYDCLVEGTMVRLADGTSKKIEDIGYDDLLLVWDFEHGRFTYEYPIWIEKKGKSLYYQLNTFSDGSTLKTVGYHGVYSPDYNKFISVDSDKFNVGTRILKVDENDKFYPVILMKKEFVMENVNYYQIVTTSYYNVISDDVMTTDGNIILVNLYGFNDDVTWKTNRQSIINDKDNLFDYEFLSDVLPYYMYDGLRAAEVKYIMNMGYFNYEDIPYLKNKLAGFNKDLLLPVPVINGSRYWMVTTSVDKVINKKDYLVKEGSIYTLPNVKDTNNFIGWYNTSDGKYYQPFDKVKVWHGMHFIASYNETS